MDEVRDKARLRALLRRAPGLHVYELGDLDDRFWPHTRWFVHGDAVALLYAATATPTLVALGDGQPALLAELARELPAELYAHLSPGLAACLPRFSDTPRGDFHKMVLVEPARALAVDVAGVEQLAPANRDEVEAFYATAYPGNWFDPRMLETGHYVGVRERGALVATAGVHVYAPGERVAAIGNVAVAPDHRGRGLATRVTAAACASLVREVELIGLNVKADNAHAIACYTRVGFAHVGDYEEHRLVARHFTADYVERATLRDGTAVRLRLLAPEDKALLRGGFERLSAGSRYARFLTPKMTLSADELRYLTEIDQERHFALGAVGEDGDGRGEPVGLGIARFVRLADGRTAEAAIAVADQAQGQGLGKLLFLRLVAAATERGIEQFRCELLCSNTAMRELIRAIAPEATTEVRAGVMTVDLALPVVAPATPPAAAPPTSPIYRLFKAAAGNALEWTDAVRRMWRR